MPICLRALEAADRDASLNCARSRSEVKMRYQTLKLTKFYQEPEPLERQVRTNGMSVSSASSIRSSNSGSGQSLLGNERGKWFWTRSGSELSKDT